MHFYTVIIDNLLIENKDLKLDNISLKLELENLKEQLEHDKLSFELENKNLKEQLESLRRLVFSRKSERFTPVDARQMDLFNPDAHKKTPAALEEQTKRVVIDKHSREVKKKSKHKGRSLLSRLGHLPYKEVEIEVDHGENDICIGQVERCSLGYTPGHFFINKEVAKKYKSPETGKISKPNFPAQPIPSCEAHITLLVYICVAKFVDHLPEHRQQKIFKRDGVAIAPSTMNGWIHKCADLLRPMSDHIGKMIMRSGCMMIDESSIKVLKCKKRKSHTGWMWVIYSASKRCVQFIYHNGREHAFATELLREYEGKYQSDGYKAYDAIDALNKNADHSNCNAHARRNFEKALTNDKVRATHAMLVYQKLYDLERTLRRHKEQNEKLNLEEYYAYRSEERKKLIPVIEEYKQWLDEQYLKVLPKSNIGKAMHYVMERWTKLTKYIYDGELEIDTNLIENTIRGLALGRKNYLFAGSPEAASNIAVFYSIFGTCKHLGINPTEYLNWYLEKVASVKICDIATLSPWEFKNLNADEHSKTEGSEK